MANELKITDVVDPKAFTQLQNLKKDIDETYTSYKNFIDLLAKGMQDKPSSLQDLSNKSANYNKALNELITTQNKLSDLQKEHETLIKRITEQTKENVTQILAEAKANDLNAAAELRTERVKTEKLKQEKLLNQERKKTKYTIEEGIAALSMEIKTMEDAGQQNKILRSARKQLDLTTEDGRKVLEKFNAVINRNDELLDKNSDSLTRAKNNVGKYRDDIKKAASEILKGNSSLKNMGNLAKSTGGLLKSSMGAGLAEVRIGVASMIKGMLGAQAIIGAFQKMIGLFKSGVQSIVDFEAANSKLAAILGTTSNNIKDMTADARRLGAATKYTASEATNLQIELAKLGFSRKEILQSTEGILKFAQATGADLPEAAALAGASLRMFDAETRETERYVSAMAVATTKSALSFSYLQTAMPIVGPVAKAFNFQIEDTLALLGKLADAGFDASMSATATRNILLNLADGSGKLAKALGGPVKTLPELVAGLKKLKEQGVDLNTTLELTDKRSVAAFNAFLTAADKIVPLREQITGVTSELNDMANTMGNNVQGALAGLSSAWESFMLSFYESKGIMKEVIDFLSKGIRNIANNMKGYDQLQEDANNRAVANAQSEMAQSDVLERHRNNMSKLYEEKIKEGMSADEAAIAAKEEYLQTLKSQLDMENKEYSDEIKKREGLEKEIEDRGAFRKGTIYGWLYDKTSIGRTKKVIEEDIKTATTAAAGKKAIASITESIIDDLNKVDLKQVEVSQNTLGKNLTDKELEKQRKERLRIQQEYQQSELDLMDEGLGKELARIRLNYTKRIAAVKGNTQEEIKTRENLAVAMEDELSEKIYIYNQNKEKIDLQNRLEALSTNSQDELEQRLLFQLRANEILKDAEIKAAKDTDADVSEIEAKYLKKRNDIVEKNILARVGLIEKNTSKETNAVQNGAEDQLRAVELQHRKGEINEKEYRQKTYEITKDSIQEQLRLLNIQLQAELAALNPADTKSDALKEKIEKVKSEIKKLNEEIEDLTFDKEKSDRQDWADGFIDAMSNMRSATEEYLGETASLFGAFYSVIGKMTEKFVNTGDFSLSKWWEKLDPKDKASLILESYAEIFNGITSLMTAAFDSRIEQIEEEQEKNQAAKEEELENIEKLAENGAISTEEAEARKRAAEDRTAQKDKELEKQKAELKQKQARWDKANSIIQATIATALAVTKALPNFVLAAIVGALGAAQVAMIAAQPIPKYAKGTDNHPGGLAIVGDGGKQEVIATDDGAYITPSVPTLVDIPKRAKVIPNIIDYRKMALHSDALMLDRQRRNNNGDEPVIVNVNNDYTKLERKFDDLYGESRKTNRTLRKISKSSNIRSIVGRIN
jgi:TP901 family phage tail tape measure protein